MGTRYIVGDFRTGRRLVTLPSPSGTWSNVLDSHDVVTVAIPLNNKVARSLDLRSTATAPKHFLAAIDTGAFGEGVEVLAAGPIWSVDYDRPGMSLKLAARGILSYFDHLNVLPLAALTLPVTDWTIPDPADPAGVGTMPNPAVGTYLSGLSIGGMIVTLIAQAMSWPGADIPLILPVPELGTSVKNYEGLEQKRVGAAITDLVRLDNGVEVRAPARLTPDQLGIEWVLEVGTVEKPLIYAENPNGPITWNLTARESPVKDFAIDVDGSGVASLSWATGGRQADVVLVSRAYDTTLVSSGYPLLMTTDSTHSDVVFQSTLDSYSQANLVYASRATETWSFTVKAHPLDRRLNAAGPQLEDYDVGDFVKLHIDPYDEETGLGDLFIPGGGDYMLRITSLSGDHKGEDVVIKCAPRLA